jgi:hypothetical protein
MNAAALAHVEQVLTQRYHAALCSPSDMVGIVAQSIAEPSTQMVLNSVTWDTELLILTALTKTTIGEFTDGTWRARRARPGGAPTGYASGMWIKDRDVRIGSIDEEGRALDAGRGVHAPPGRQRGRQQHGVQGDSAEWRRGHRHARGQYLLKRIGNKIVHATVDDFCRRLPAHGRHPAAGRADLDAGPDRLGQSHEGGVHVGGGQAIDLYHNGGMFTQRCESYGEAGTDTAQLGLHKAVAGYTQSVLPTGQEPQWWRHGQGIPSRCRSNGRRLHGELQRRQERGEQHTRAA